MTSKYQSDKGALITIFIVIIFVIGLGVFVYFKDKPLEDQIIPTIPLSSAEICVIPCQTGTCSFLCQGNVSSISSKNLK